LKNILVIHQSSELYGSDKTLLYLFSKVNTTQYQFVVVLPSEGPLKQAIEKLNFPVYIVPVLKLHRKLFTIKNLLQLQKDFKQSIKALKKLHQKYHFQIIYSNTLAVMVGAIISKKWHIPHLWHVHEIIEHPKPIAWLYPRILYKYANSVICNSKATKNNLVKRLPLLDSKTTVITNGIDFSNYSVKETEESSSEMEQFNISLIGRVSRLKGHRWLIHTFEKYLKQELKLHLQFVGSPVPGQEFHEAEIKQLIKAYQLENRVTWLSFQEDLQPIWNTTHLCVMPSTEAESFGLVALESMRAGVPVIASNLGGLKEILEEKGTGILVEPNNEKELAEAILYLYKNPNVRSEQAYHAFVSAQKKFNLETYVNSFEKAFDSIK